MESVRRTSPCVRARTCGSSGGGPPRAAAHRACVPTVARVSWPACGRAGSDRETRTENESVAAQASTSPGRAPPERPANSSPRNSTKPHAATPRAAIRKGRARAPSSCTARLLSASVAVPLNRPLSRVYSHRDLSHLHRVIVLTRSVGTYVEPAHAPTTRLRQPYQELVPCRIGKHDASPRRVVHGD